MTKIEVVEWGKKVLSQLKQKTDLNCDDYIFLAGEKYSLPLVTEIKNYSQPLKGMGIGKRLKYLHEHL